MLKNSYIWLYCQWLCNTDINNDLKGLLFHYFYSYSSGDGCLESIVQRKRILSNKPYTSLCPLEFIKCSYSSFNRFNILEQSEIIPALNEKHTV